MPGNNKQGGEFVRRPDPEWHKRFSEVFHQQGWEQAELARRIGVKRAAINKWLAGTVKSPQHSTIDMACQVLGISLEWLLYGTGEKSRVKNAGAATTNYRNVPVVGRILPGGQVDRAQKGVAVSGAARLPSTDSSAYVYEVSGYDPAIPDGYGLLVEPDSPLVPNERCIVRTSEGIHQVFDYIGQSETYVTLQTINDPRRRVTLDLAEIDLILPAPIQVAPSKIGNI